MDAEYDVTVVTICRNAAATIGRTIDSVLGQCALPKEYLFVDGGSSDGTLAAIAARTPMLEKRGVRCRVLHQECPAGVAGIPHAWNMGLAEASGNVVALLNADDWYEPETLFCVKEAFAAHPGCEAVAMPVAYREPDGSVRLVFGCHPMGQLPWRMTVPHPGCFFTSGLYRRLGGYDTAYRISADYDFVWRCRRAGVKWCVLQEALVNMQAGGMAESGRAMARRETLTIARRHTSFLDMRPWLAWLLRIMTGR